MMCKFSLGKLKGIEGIRFLIILHIKLNWLIQKGKGEIIIS